LIFFQVEKGNFIAQGLFILSSSLLSREQEQEKRSEVKTFIAIIVISASEGSQRASLK